MQASQPDADLSFEFVDGPLLANPAPPVDHFFRGPFYAFYRTQDLESLERAHAWLLDLLKERGPFDGVLAFSQGCALASTLMLKLQRKAYDSGQEAKVRQPFKFAIFICGGLPLSFLADQGYAISDTAWQHDKQSGQLLSSQASFAALLQNGNERWSHEGWRDVEVTHRGNDSEKRVKDLILSGSMFGLDLAQVAEEHKIPISTVHIYGSRDPRMGSALQLAGLCSSDKARVACHGGGHDIPRTSRVSDMLADLVFWASTQTIDDGTD